MEKKLKPLQLLLLLISFFLSINEFITSCNGETNTRCRETERQALLDFKNGLKDPHGLISSSWEGENCCRWRGVACNNETRDVVSIDLQFDHLSNGLTTALRIGGTISSSLLELKHLNHLDLSSNDFRGSSIPKFIGSMSELTYLNLSGAGFGGMIPQEIGNLSRLRYLDLNSLSSPYDLSAGSLEWLSHLSSLEYLDMSSVYIGGKQRWLQAVTMLPSLSVLRLPNCGLHEMISTSSFASVSNLTSLAALDLANNQFYSGFPDWLFNLSRIEYLNLQFNHFQGTIPDLFDSMTSLEVIKFAGNKLVGSIPPSIANLCNIKTLDLSSNNLTGDITKLAQISSGCAGHSLEILNLRDNELQGELSDWLREFKRLAVLHLGDNLLHGSISASIGMASTLKSMSLDHNMLNGSLPESIGQLAELILLDVSNNLLNGSVSEIHFANLSKLEQLSLSSNSLVMNMSYSWVPPFRLRSLGLGHCKLGPKFPTWLQTQKNYGVMDLSHAGIVDTVPDWFWNLSKEIYMLDISRNQLTGTVSKNLEFASISVLDLSFNKFDGTFPHLSSMLEYLDISGNSFSGTLQPFFSKPLPSFAHLLLSHNLISGPIPASICNYVDLFGIDLSNNLLSGKLPECLGNLGSLTAISLASNNLSGEIPSSIGDLSWLQALRLCNNSFNGSIPMSLSKCTRLVTLDFGDNRLSGEIPIWIGESLPFLRILRLRANKFHGIIPPQLSLLTKLQILDLGNNSLSGSIPRSLGNIAAMTMTHKPNERMVDVMQLIVGSSLNNYGGPLGYVVSLEVVIKGRELEYSNNLQYVASIDLSCNNLSGFIPQELTDLFGLQNLNLSCNHLSGVVPDKIGELKLLESLDLSRNKLAGSLPASMSLLTALSHLNLSFNDFSGRIPSGYQLQTLDDPSIYMGNPGLCGPPLNHGCAGDKKNGSVIASCTDEEGDGECDESEMVWLYVAMIPGFVAGFWALWGPLLFNQRFRSAYFRLIDTLCVAAVKKMVGNQEVVEEK